MSGRRMKKKKRHARTCQCSKCVKLRRRAACPQGAARRPVRTQAEESWEERSRRDPVLWRRSTFVAMVWESMDYAKRRLRRGEDPVAVRRWRRGFERHAVDFLNCRAELY